MGAEVTVVEMLDRILPVEDEEVSAFMHKALTKQGMKIHVGAGVEKLEATKTGVKAAIKGADGKVVQDDFSHAIVAIGIVPNRSEEHTSELQSLMRISYAVFCLKKKTNNNSQTAHNTKDI